MNYILKSFFLIISSLMFFGCQTQTKEKPDLSISQVMDSVVTRVYQKVPHDKLNEIDEAFLTDFISVEEKETLASKYWYFNVNVPVTVSLMRDMAQKNWPFWLAESGFQKTDLSVKNEHYGYEVWTKNYDEGLIELGINGFDKHRPVYFISVAPQDPQDELNITEIFPKDQAIDTLQPGKYTYHDWTELVLTEVPESINGQLLFQTIRGRAREAHLLNAFRQTPYPSDTRPDQLMLTWSGSPKNSADIQWRTKPEVKNGVVRYWKENDPDTLLVVADSKQMEDRLLSNDRFINRFTTKLKDLNSGTRYVYQAGDGHTWTEPCTFETEPEENDHFSFVWFGDTHNSPEWGKLLHKADSAHPDVAFYSIAGDIVSTGLYRDQWDELFAYSGKVLTRKPMMPVPGNHDRQDGLGAWMYYDFFSLPENGPLKVRPESTYAFEYGDALFLMIDSTFPVEDQREWMEEQLKNTKANWKFAMFHFPPYNFEEPYPEIRREWVPVFDQYHVDMVMAGHIHYYMRSKPLRKGKIVDSFDDGTVYVTSIGIQGNHDTIGEEPYAEVRYADGQFYQHMEISGDKLIYQSYNEKGELKDSFTIRK